MARAAKRRIVFTLPAAMNTRAPEFLYCWSPTNNVKERSDPVNWVSAVIEPNVDLPADAALYMDVLRVGGNPTVASDWILGTDDLASSADATALRLAGVDGVRFAMGTTATAPGAPVEVALNVWWEANT